MGRGAPGRPGVRGLSPGGCSTGRRKDIAELVAGLA
jgi:hypothetical protein